MKAIILTLVTVGLLCSTPGPQRTQAQATCSGIEFEGTVRRSSAIVECGVAGTIVSVVYYRVNRVVVGTLHDRNVWVAVRCPLGEREGGSHFATGQRHRVCISDRAPRGHVNVLDYRQSQTRPARHGHVMQYRLPRR